MPTAVKMTGPVRLDELIEAIRATHTDPLEQLSGAVLTAEALDDLADSLVGHFVDQARRSGASWAEIGRSMGVTKQAVQKRFADRGAAGREQGHGPGQAQGQAQGPGAGQGSGDGFARFTVHARNVVVVSQNESRAAGAAEIAPAHLLLGLVADPGSLAARALAGQGLPADAVRRAVLDGLPPAGGEAPALIPFDAGARRVLEGAFSQADRLREQGAGDGRVGTGHVLLALLAEVAEHGGLPGGPAVDPARAEADVVRLLAADGPSGEDGEDSAARDSAVGDSAAGDSAAGGGAEEDGADRESVGG